MLRMENSQMTRATRSVSGPLHSVDTSSLVTNHSSPATASGEAKKSLPARFLEGPWPPWRLIAIHANLKIAATHSQQSTSLFLTATRIVLLNSCCRQSRPPTAATPPRFGRSPNPIVTAQANRSGEMRFLPQGGDNFSSGFDIVSSEDSGVPEVYNPDRFLRRHP